MSCFKEEAQLKKNFILLVQLSEGSVILALKHCF